MEDYKGPKPTFEDVVAGNKIDLYDDTAHKNKKVQEAQPLFVEFKPQPVVVEVKPHTNNTRSGGLRD